MSETQKNSKFILVLIIYLLGIFMGAIDTGIVTPARTIIQSNLGVNEQLGIWMITIYTLAYAASIPIMGKLADKFGRKNIYLTSIFLFGLGSLMCGLSQSIESFNFLLVSRVIQALGGGGILPVATAEFGTTFPEEKRGLALGLVGGVYGVANIFGASAGSAILDIFGSTNWQFIFYVNIPITIFILIAGFIHLDNTKVTDTKKIDFKGIFVLTVMTLSLLYGLKNLDFFNLASTITNKNVLPFFLIFIIFIPLFIFIERRADDPVINLSYFTDKNILLTLLISFITGFVMMGMVFVPQFAENAMKIASGSGGYFVIILGLFAGISSPLSGKLIDKFGARVVLGFGFLISIIGSLYLACIATIHPTTVNVILSLILIGIGIGFTIGSPLNYMMLDHTKDSESNSALATLSLIRSIGTTIAPAIMVGFLAHAGSNIQDKIIDDLPDKINLPKLPYAQDITEGFNELKHNPQMKDKLANVNIPDLTAMETVHLNFNNDSNYKIPDDMIQLMKDSDVTTITKNTKAMSNSMFKEMTPDIIKNIDDGLQQGIDGLNQGISQMASLNISMNSSMPPQMTSSKDQSISPVTESLNSIKSLRDKMITLKNYIPKAFDKGEKSYMKEIDKRSTKLENTFQSVLSEGFKNIYFTTAISSVVGLIFLFFYKDKTKNL